MAIDETPDVEQIVARIRASMRADHGDARANGGPPAPPGLAAEQEIATDIRTLHASHDLSRGRGPSPRRLVGPLVDGARRVVDRVLAPILAQQATYNAAVCRVVTQAVARLDAIAEQGARTARAAAAQEERANALAETLAAHGDALGPIRSGLHSVQEGAAALAQESAARHDQALALDAHVSALGQTLADLRGELDAARDRAVATAARLEECRDQIARHQGQAAIDREQLAACREQLAALQRAAADHREEIAAGSARLRLQQDQLDRVARDADDQQRRIADLAPRLAALDGAVAEHGQGLAALGSRLQAQNDTMASVRDGAAARDDLAKLDATQTALVAGLRERVARTERRLRALANASNGGRPGDEDGGGPMPPTGDRARLDGLDYAGFEERFRGSEDEIRQRQRSYVDLFRAREDVVDLGCGRGEFLELLRAAGVAGRGVDVDLDMILLCREKGLQVAHADAFAYLEGVPDDSLGGVFAAQVVEHLEPPRLLALVALIHRKLRPGGIAVLETVNPECLATFATFYLDLTHVRPIPPGTLQFVLESAGFADVRIAYTSAVDEAVRIPHLDPALFADARRFNASIGRVNELLFGCRDFAAIATKSPVAPSPPATG